VLLFSLTGKFWNESKQEILFSGVAFLIQKTIRDNINFQPNNIFVLLSDILISFNFLLGSCDDTKNFLNVPLLSYPVAKK